MMQVERGGTIERTGRNCGESGDRWTAGAAIPDASRSKMRAAGIVAAPGAPHPHVEPDWREE